MRGGTGLSAFSSTSRGSTSTHNYKREALTGRYEIGRIGAFVVQPIVVSVSNESLGGKEVTAAAKANVADKLASLMTQKVRIVVQDLQQYIQPTEVSSASCSYR